MQPQLLDLFRCGTWTVAVLPQQERPQTVRLGETQRAQNVNAAELGAVSSAALELWAQSC